MLSVSNELDASHTVMHRGNSERNSNQNSIGFSHHRYSSHGNSNHVPQHHVRHSLDSQSNLTKCLAKSSTPYLSTPAALISLSYDHSVAQKVHRRADDCLHDSNILFHSHSQSQGGFTMHLKTPRGSAEQSHPTCDTNANANANEVKKPRNIETTINADKQAIESIEQHRLVQQSCSTPQIKSSSDSRMKIATKESSFSLNSTVMNAMDVMIRPD